MFPNQFTDSLWGDEAFSAILSQKPFWEMIKIVARDTSPPLYYICEYALFRLFGTSEAAIRSLSFIFHLGTVLTIFFLAKYLWDKKTAVIAAILTFLNPFLFIYAFEGRMYAILAFTTTLSFYAYFRAFHNSTNPNISARNDNLVWKIFYALASASALYSHHFSIFAVFVQGLWVLPIIINSSFRQNNIRNFLKKFFTVAWPFFLTILLYLPWLPALYFQTTMVASGFWLSTPTFKNLLELIGKFIVGGQEYKLKTFVLALVGVIILTRKWQFKKRTEWILTSWFALPLFLTWTVSQIMQSIFFDRYMLFAIPAIALILASKRRFFVSLASIFLISVILFLVDWHYFTHPSKRPFRELASYIKQEINQKDALINWNSAAHHLWEIKYYGLDAPIYSPGGPLPFFVGTAQMTKDDVIYTPPDNRRIGVITSGDLEEIAITGYNQSGSRQFGSLKFIWLEKTTQQSTE